MKTTPKPGLRQTYVNLKKANWDRYRLEAEAALSKRSLPTDCQRDEKILRTILLKAASHHIPTVRHRLHEEPVPAEILDVMTRRDDLRKIHQHLELHASQYKQKTHNPSFPLHKHTTYFNTPRLKHFFNNGRYTTNIITTDAHTVTTKKIRPNMRHIHTSIVSRHLSTSGNNKILRTPPPHISCSEEILSRLTRCSPAQPRTNKSPFLKSYLHKVDDKSLPSPLCPLYNTHIHTSSLQLHLHTHHIVTPMFVDRLHRSDCTAGQIDGEAGWWTTSDKIGLPPTRKGHGSG